MAVWRRLAGILARCAETETPVIFALKRRRLGMSVLKVGAPVSIVAILDYGGADDEFHAAMSLAEAACETYSAEVTKRSVGREHLAGEGGRAGSGDATVGADGAE